MKECIIFLKNDQIQIFSYVIIIFFLKWTTKYGQRITLFVATFFSIPHDKDRVQ